MIITSNRLTIVSLIIIIITIVESSNNQKVGYINLFIIIENI